jgi:hypothetical protein
VRLSHRVATEPAWTLFYLAAAHPDKVAAMQARLNALGKEQAKALALIYVGQVGLAHGKPNMASEDGQGATPVNADGHAITDEGFGVKEVPVAPAGKH